MGKFVLFSLLILTALPIRAVDQVTVEIPEKEVLGVADQVTVELLEKEVLGAHGKLDKDVAKRLGQLELTERLSAARFERLKAYLPGERSVQALLALADASAFLDPPAMDILPFGPPDFATQGQIMSRAATS